MLNNIKEYNILNIDLTKPWYKEINGEVDIKLLKILLNCKKKNSSYIDNNYKNISNNLVNSASYLKYLFSIVLDNNLSIKKKKMK